MRVGPVVPISSQPGRASLLVIAQDHTTRHTQLWRPKLYAAEKPFYRGEKGQLDFVAIEAIIKAQNSSSISQQALLMPTIITNLFLINPSTIPADYNFSFFGGNLPLLSKLSCFHEQAEAALGVAYDYAEPTCGQTHPLALIMTIIFFYPLKPTIPGVHHSPPLRRALAAHQQHALLGAKNVKLDSRMSLGEVDLLELKDDRESIGKRVVHTFTSLSPSAIIKDGGVSVPHSSSFDDPG
ncbi:hypothetical protein FIBSPDRAFT_964014 [Athelia psychrophila]|uniref:Uncharacterized protein n=1 Tax=Athelia psychrophila TaxID=1759441 RepID=A0A165YBM1_9AGAM|nr:hypothetical protein FIBSPDRAFT_964014 [Fibularhizoctonia sp. CBS 109695]